MWQLQNILVYLALLAAVIYLVRKYIIKKKGSASPDCGGGECNCH